MDGQLPRDVIEYQLLADQAELELDVRRGGLEQLGHGDPGRAASRSASRSTPPCSTGCGPATTTASSASSTSCPKGLRRSLYVRDDDYRLSFLYGNFTTLTRFTEADLERVVTEGLSPLWVSIHATDPEVRARMLRNRRGATSLRWLRALLDHGIEVHGQVVVCPGRQRRRRPRRHPRRRARPLPGAGQRGLRAPRGQPVQRRGRHAAPHPAEASRRGRPGGGLAADLPAGARAAAWCTRPTSTTCSPAGPFPPRTPTATSPSTTTASAWPGPSKPASTGRTTLPPAVPAGSSSRSTAPRRPATGRPATPAPVTLRPRPRRTRHRADRHLRGRRCSGRWSPPSARTPRSWPSPNGFFGGNIGVAGLLTGADLTAALAGPRSAGATCCPTCACPAGGSSTGCGPEDLPRPVEVVPADGAALRAALSPGDPESDRERLPAPSAARGRRGRPAQRRQEHPRQPDRRPPRGHRGGAARRHPGPQVPGRRMGGPRVHHRRHRRLAGRRGRLDRQVSAQAERAIADADVVLLVVDATVGVTDEDARVAALLRRLGRPTLVVANKVDGDSRDTDAWAFARLGLGDPYPVSALHGRGTGDLLDDLVAALPAERRPRTAADRHGQPKGSRSRRWPSWVGPTWASRPCSTGSSATSAPSSTTCPARPATASTPWCPPRTATSASSTPPACAGGRKEAEGAEYYSLVRALQALDRAQAALLVIDATEGITRQDQRLAERVDAAGSPVVIILNKWELLDAEQRATGQRGPRGPAGLPGLRPGSQGQRPDRPRGAQAYPALQDSLAAVPAPGADRGAQPGPGRGPGRPPLAWGPGPVRHPGGDRPAHVHPVRHQGRSRRPICGTWSGASGSISASVRPRGVPGPPAVS